MSAFFWKAALLVFYSQNLKMALSESKAAEFYRDTDSVLNFCYLAIKLPSFKSVDEKLPEWNLECLIVLSSEK